MNPKHLVNWESQEGRYNKTAYDDGTVTEHHFTFGLAPLASYHF